MFRYGSKLAGDSSLVKDVIQDLFLRFYEKEIDLTGHPAPDAYIIKSFRRDLIKVMQKRASGPVPENMPVLYTPDDLLIKAENSNAQKVQVMKMLNALSHRQREIIWLHYFEDKSYREIADILDVNYQSVLNNLQRAFRKIRNEFPSIDERLF